MISPVTTINQHYIPRLLLRRFSRCENPEAKSKRRKYLAFEVRSEGGNEKNIVDIASDEYFFEREIVNGESVEDKLKVKEDRYGRLISKIESELIVHRSQDRLITDLVSNLSFQTESNRLDMSKLVSDTMSWARKQVIADKPFIEKVKKETLDKLVSEHGQGLDRELVAQARFKCKNSREFKEEINRSIDQLPLISELVEARFISESYDLAQRTQCSLISDGSLNDSAALQGIKWKVHSYEDSLLLGDVGPIAYCRSVGSYIPLMWSLLYEDIDHIVLPINRFTALIGETLSCDGSSVRLASSAYIVNFASASLSHNFFVTDSSALAQSHASYVGSVNGKYNSEWVRERLPF